MTKASILKAERQFAASQKRDRQEMEDKDKARQERADNVARLRALRLGRDAGAGQALDGAQSGPTRSPLTDSSQFPQARRG